MDNIDVVIDGKLVKTAKGSTVLEAARSAGIYIPTLCYHPDLSLYGACRLCVVEIDGMRGLPTACNTPAADGMIVRTDTLQLQKFRQGILELILSEGRHVCLVCHANGQCELQEVAKHIGLEGIELPTTFKEKQVDKDSPFFDRDYNLCIICGRCVRMCDEVRGSRAIAFTMRGSEMLVVTPVSYTHLTLPTNREV